MRHKRRFPLLLGLLVALAVTLAACGGGDDEVGRIASSGDDEVGRIVFFSVRDGNPDFYVMNADGTGQTRLTTSSGFFPAWAP